MNTYMHGRKDGILKNKVKIFCKNINVVDWINSYNVNRRKYANWNNVKSNVNNNFPISIVQGSSIGPKLFYLLINDSSVVTKLYLIICR